MGVTQLHDVVYVVYSASRSISRFCATTHQRLSDVDVTYRCVSSPTDIAACEQTSQLYVAYNRQCVWRVSVSSYSRYVENRWLPKSPSATFRPSALSVTASRLLVTSLYDKQLMQFDAGGDQLTLVELPSYMGCLLYTSDAADE